VVSGASLSTDGVSVSNMAFLGNVYSVDGQGTQASVMNGEISGNDLRGTAARWYGASVKNGGSLAMRSTSFSQNFQMMGGVTVSGSGSVASLTEVDFDTASGTLPVVSSQKFVPTTRSYHLSH
jgi:hypothetical protein